MAKKRLYILIIQLLICFIPVFLSMSNIYFNDDVKLFSGSDMLAKTGSVANGSRIARELADSSGYLAYGPYIALSSGKYSYVLTYTSDVEGNITDIYENANHNKIAEKKLPIGTNQKIVIEFEIKNISAENKIEFRTYFSGKGNLEVVSIEIEKYSNFVDYILCIVPSLLLAIIFIVIYWGVFIKLPNIRANFIKPVLPEYSIYFCILVLVSIIAQLITPFHANQHGDSILLSLMSLNDPAMYFWYQNQYLSFIPFIFSVIKDPQVNLICINVTFHIMLFSIPYLLAKIFRIKNPILFCLIFSLFLLPFTKMFIFELSYQPYVPSVFFSLLSIMMLLKGFGFEMYDIRKHLYLLFSSLFLVVSFKIGQPVIILYLLFIGSVVVKYSLIKKGDKIYFSRSGIVNYTSFVYVLLTLLVYYCFSLIEGRYFISNAIPIREMIIKLDMNYILHGIIEISKNIYKQFIDNEIVLISFLVISFLMLIFSVLQKRINFLVRSVIIYIVPAILILLLMTSLTWTEQNKYFARYSIYSILLIILFITNVVFELIKTKFNNFSLHSRIINIGFIFLIISTLFIKDFGLSGFKYPVENVSVRVKDVAKIGAFNNSIDAVYGNYWDVWTTVWYVNAIENRRVAGFSYRGDQYLKSIKNEIEDNARFNLLFLSDDNNAERLLLKYFHVKIPQNTEKGKIIGLNK